MSFIVGLIAAAALMALFALAAFSWWRVLCIHLLASAVFFILLPTITFLSEESRPGALAGADLADALAAHWYLYVLYLAGLGITAAVANDARAFGRIQHALRIQRPQLAWVVTFYVVLLTSVGIMLTFDIALSGSVTTEKLLGMPYAAVIVLSIAKMLLFGLFCYMCIVSRVDRLALIGCAAFLGWMIVSEGRRVLLLSLLVFYMLRSAQVSLRFNLRYVLVGLALISLFTLITPYFKLIRVQSQNLEARGYSQVEALVTATSEVLTLDDDGKSATDIAVANIARRGNAGLFLLDTASGMPSPYLGELIWTSVLWIVPSSLAEKPAYEAEQLIQLAIGAEFIDDANSVPTVFLGDFGALGMLIAGLYTGFMLYALVYLIQPGRQFGLFEIAALGAFFQLSVLVENELSGTFVMARNLAIIWVVTAIAGAVRPRARLRYAPVRPIRESA